MSGDHVLFVDPVGGLAGDMFLAACLDVGVPQDALEAELRKLGVTGWKLDVKRDFEASIAGLHVDVVVEGEQPHERSYLDITRLIEASTLSLRVKQASLKVFRAIGEAEAHVHRKSLETIHFHEVGAVDSIIDICGAAICLELLGWPRVLCSPPPAGSGTAKTVHGIIAIPGPATLEVMKGRRLRSSGPGERTTPTGAAICVSLTEEADSMPDLAIEKVGYGVGTKKWDDAPNIVRAVLGRSPKGHDAKEALLVEANVDDATGQMIAQAIEKFLAAGALDAWSTATIGKKGRPAATVHALCERNELEAIKRLFWRETTTIGVRVTTVERTVLDRGFVEVAVTGGTVRVKMALDRGHITNLSPESDDCRRIAEATGASWKDVWTEALALAHQQVRKPQD